MKLRRKPQKVRVEMLPLMDVVFLLLVFFIYSMMSMSVHRALPLNLPKSGAAESDRSVALALTVKADGALYLNKEPVSPDALTDALTQTLAARKSEQNDPEPSVQIFAEDSLSYQDLFRVLDRVKAAGIRKVSLQASPEGQGHGSGNR